jgi:glycosyltransferase involved in cell wall biosynthesis
MKIAYVIPTMGCGGAEILLGAIARNLVRKGHEVHILCLQEHHETWINYPDREALLNEVTVKIIGGKVDFKFLKNPSIDNSEFVEHINKFKPDVIHSHLYLSDLLSRSLLFEDVKYFSHGHDNMPQLQRFTIKTLFQKVLLVNFWERIWLIKQYKKSNNKFIAISKDVKSYFEINLSNFKKRVVYLPNAIDTSRFHVARDYKSNFNDFHIVSIANLVPKKNHILLVEVMSILLRKGYKVTMDVYGFGPLFESLINETKKAGIDNQLKFKGSVGNIPQKLEEADLYVHPAWYEPFGLVILEAMASGLPVVALDGYGNRELMKENSNGFMLPNNSTAEDFADKIAYFIDQPSERERMGKFAFEFSKTYDINNYTNKLIDIYQN